MTETKAKKSSRWKRPARPAENWHALSQKKLAQHLTATQLKHLSERLERIERILGLYEPEPEREVKQQ